MGTDPKNMGSGLGFASRVGMEMAFSVLIGVYGGYLLDKYFATTPWLMLLGVIFGGVAGFLSVYKAYQGLENNNDKEDPPKKN